MALLQHGALQPSNWRFVGDDAAIPAEEPVTVSLKRWQAEGETLRGRNTPIGVHATAVSEESISVKAFLGLPDGTHWIRDELEMAHPHGTDLVGHRVAERLGAAGAEELLAEAERLVAAG